MIHPTRKIALIAASLFLMAGCTGDALSYSQWSTQSKAFYGDVLRVTPGDLEGADRGFTIEAMVSAYGVDAPYQTAIALNALGSGARAHFSAAEWEAVTERLRGATADPPSLDHAQNAAPRVYAGYEIAWADRIFEILTPEQRVALAGAIDPAELFERSGDRAPDLGDVAVTLRSLDLLAVRSHDHDAEATALMEGWREAICSAGSSDGQDFALAASISDHVPLPCSDAERAAQWEELVSGAQTRARGADHLDAATSLVNLAQVQENLWPSDATRKQVVAKLLDEWVLRGRRLTPVEAIESLPVVQKVAHRFGRAIPLASEAEAHLAAVAREGAEPARQVMTGRTAAYPFLDARTLGVTIATPEGFPEGMPAAEQLAVSWGRGESLTDEKEALVAGVLAEGRPELVLSVIAPWVMGHGQEGCDLPGALDGISRALGTGGGSAVGPDSDALGIRALEGCGRAVQADRRDGLVSTARQIMSDDPAQTSLEAQFIATSILCALDPEAATLGPDAWERLRRFAMPSGGATDGSGYADIVATHHVLAISESDRAQCAQTGLLGGAR